MRTEGGAGPGSSGQPLASSGAATPAGGRSARRATDQLEDLAREILVLRACHDRNIVAFVGASLQAGHAVLVTEYMPNGDLLGAIESDTFGRFAWARRAGPGGRPVPGTGMNRRIALDVARGLHFLHSRRVVHLDLKSANVLLARDWTAKVADVGMSKILRTRFLSSLIGVGTFAWAAPVVSIVGGGAGEPGGGGVPCSPGATPPPPNPNPSGPAGAANGRVGGRLLLWSHPVGAVHQRAAPGAVPAGAAPWRGAARGRRPHGQVPGPGPRVPPYRPGARPLLRGLGFRQRGGEGGRRRRCGEGGGDAARGRRRRWRCCNPRCCRHACCQPIFCCRSGLAVRVRPCAQAVGQPVWGVTVWRR